jgi:hypothetical protein
MLDILRRLESASGDATPTKKKAAKGAKEDGEVAPKKEKKKKQKQSVAKPKRKIVIDIKAYSSPC